MYALYVKVIVTHVNTFIIYLFIYFFCFLLLFFLVLQALTPIKLFIAIKIKNKKKIKKIKQLRVMLLLPGWDAISSQG